ncbi:MAG: AAA family ATPase [Thermus sp.]
MPRLVAIEAPAGWGKSTYLLRRAQEEDGVYVAFFPGEGTIRDLIRLLYSALFHEPAPEPLPRATRELLDRLEGQAPLLLMDDIHHLIPEAGDILLALLEATPVRLVVAGRHLIPLRFLPRLLGRGVAERLGPEDLTRLVGFPPLALDEEVEARLEAMPEGLRASLVDLAGLPLWREGELWSRGLSYPLLVGVHGLPIHRHKGVYWPHEALQEALVRRASREILSRNAARLEEENPALSARLYLLSGHPDRAVKLALRRAPSWLAESAWGEAIAWLSEVPAEALSPLGGLLALALLETGQVERALALARAYPEDALSLIALAIHAYRAGEFAESLRLAQEALGGRTFATALTHLLARRVSLAARLALGERDLKEETLALLEEAQPYPGQALAVQSFLLHLVHPETRLEGAERGFRHALATCPHRAVGFLQAYVEAALLLAHRGQPGLVARAIELARELREAGRTHRFVLPFALFLEGGLHAFRGQLEEAASALEQAQEEALTWPIPDVWRAATELLTEVRLAQGLLEAAHALVGELEAHGHPSPLYKGLLALYRGDMASALPLLEVAAEGPLAKGALARALLGRPVDPEEEPWVLVSLSLLGGIAPWGGRVLSLRERVAYVPERVDLTEREFVYLLALLQGPATPQELAERVYGEGGTERVGAVHTSIFRLRAKRIPGLETLGNRYVLRGYRLDIALHLEAARHFPHLLQAFDPDTLIPGEEPVYAYWREEIRQQAKAVALEWAHKGVALPHAHLLDPEDPVFLEALGHRAAIEALREGNRWH